MVRRFLEQATNTPSLPGHCGKFPVLRPLLFHLSPKSYNIWRWLHKPADTLLAAFAKAEMVSSLKLLLEKCWEEDNTLTHIQNTYLGLI